MTESVVIDVAIGVVLVFVVFSVAVAKINELVLGLFNYRAKQLEGALVRLAGDGGQGQWVVDKLFDGALGGLSQAKPPVKRAASRPSAAATPPAVDSAAAVSTPLRARRLGLPAYISGDTFARAVLDLVGLQSRAAFDAIDGPLLPTGAQIAYTAAAAELTLTTASALQLDVPTDDAQRARVDLVVSALRKDPVAASADFVADLPPSALRTKVLSIAARAGTDREQLQAELAHWYDDAMDRLSGWYKRRVKLFLLGYAVLLTLAFNVDSISVTQSLWRDPSVRQVAVAAAQKTINDGAVVATAGSCPSTSGTAKESTEICSAAVTAEQGIKDASSLHIPLGWQSTPGGAGDWALSVLGWLITVFALSFGAPFWFDVLGKAVNMRSSGPKPTSSTA